MFTRPLIATVTVLAIAMLFFLTVTASACHCPVDMNSIDAALPFDGSLEYRVQG